MDSDGAWRRGAARKVVTYDEAQADYGLGSDDDVNYPAGDLAIEREHRMRGGGKMVLIQLSSRRRLRRD